MKRLSLPTLLLISVFCVASFAVVDLNPRSNGTTMARNATGSSSEAVFHNPALLGLERSPTGGLLIFPLSDVGFGYWSDKLAISPFDLLDLANAKGADTSKSKIYAKVVSRIFKNSFGLDANHVDSAAVSAQITKNLGGGLKIYSGARASLFSLAARPIAFDVTTHIDEEIRIPEGPLYMLFSADKGLTRGNTLDFSNFSQEVVWATDFTFHVGLPVSIPKLHELFKLKYGAGGFGVKYVMGHSILKASSTRDSKIFYNPKTNALEVNAEVTVQTAGFGIHDNMDFRDVGKYFSKNIVPVNGHGIGIDIGGILYDDKGSLSINFENAGVLFWMNNALEATYKIHKNDFDFYDVSKGLELGHNNGDSSSMYIFNRNANEYLSDSRDGLKGASGGFVTFLPLTLNIGYGYTWSLTRTQKQALRYLAESVTLATNYEQGLAPGPGRSFIPRLSIGGEAGCLRGYLPLRMGFAVGGPEILASTLGAGFDFKYFSIQGSYKAVGNLLFYPSRGFELAGAINFNWGMKVDTDKDGIADKVDQCVTIPEDLDNFEDANGCPDPDNDQDKLCDPWVSEEDQSGVYSAKCTGIDKCQNEAEDMDMFQDEDGCPEYDNDKDFIPDTLDKCAMEPEDRDGFEDNDGCPDLDNDKDGICDPWVSQGGLSEKYLSTCKGNDLCANVAEDRDLFKDDDGCPDLDNDQDGMADSVDRCPDLPETYNGYKDDDGCPDEVPKAAAPTQKEEKALHKALQGINFKSASAELTSDSYTSLMSISVFLKKYPYLKYEIQGHTDSQGDEKYNLLLSAARANSVKNYLLSQSVEDTTIIAIGYGKSRPIATNNTAAGRALNRRVEFSVIGDDAQAASLKIQEADFKQRVLEAKIKGAKYNN